MHNHKRSPTPWSFAGRSILRIAWYYLLGHPWQTILMILGIALGVAVVVAVDLANASASRAFEYSTEAVSGRATHQIVGGPAGLDEELYVALRKSAALSAGSAAAPAVTEYAYMPDLGGSLMQMLGIDPFAEAPFRDYLGTGIPLAQLASLLTETNGVFISADLAAQHGITVGSQVTLEIAGYEQTAVVRGLLQSEDRLVRRALQSIVLADIATAQELTGRIGRLDRIDLLIPEEDTVSLERVRSALPANAQLVGLETRTGAVREMTAGFRLNLLALSMLALVVGLFLIYNTITFSVVQRRRLFGTLRCLGVTRREIFGLVAGEAFLVALLGTVAGLGLGILMGRGAIGLVTQTVGDLYFAVTVRDVDIQSTSLLKGALLGIVTTVAVALPPAWEAASAPAALALARSQLESKARLAVRRVAVAGILAGLAGLIILQLPTRSLIASFGGTLAVITGFAALTPYAATLLVAGARPLLTWAFSAVGRIGPLHTLSALSRTSVAIAALMIAVSVIIGVSLMIGSFRYTVNVWLGQTLQGDIYVTAPSTTATLATTPLDLQAVQAAEKLAGVSRIDLLRTTTVESIEGPVTLFGVENPRFGDRPFVSALGEPDAIWGAMRTGAVTISEPYAHLTGLNTGDVIMLYTAEGLKEFQIAGVYYDYVASQGTLTMSLSTYRELWGDDAVTALALYVPSEADERSVINQLNLIAGRSTQRILVRANRELRDEAMAIFDRTFAITNALQLLATVVAFIGIVSALLSIQLDRAREMGILRAIGLTVGQLWIVVFIETGLMGAVAGLLAMPTGLALSYILVHIINQRSFGWTLQMRVQPLPFVQAFGVALLAALLAGIYPASRMARTVTADALRYE